MSEKGTLLKSLLSTKKIIVAPGAHDALTAKIIERAGFEAVYVTGYGLSASVLGKPDVGLLTMTEMVSRISAIAEAVSLPLICDGDTGYGNAVNVVRTVREYEKAGAACIQLEDQITPKKCGHMQGKQVVSTEEMVGKIRAAVEARRSPDFLIMARTDARAVYGIEEAIRRGKAYEEAGADILFVEAPQSEEEMRMITSSLKVPCVANMVEGGKTPYVPVERLSELGYKIAIFPTASTFRTAKALLDMMMDLKEHGTLKQSLDETLSFDQFNELIGLDEITNLEKKFLPKVSA